MWIPLAQISRMYKYHQSRRNLNIQFTRASLENISKIQIAVLFVESDENLRSPCDCSIVAEKKKLTP